MIKKIKTKLNITYKNHSYIDQQKAVFLYTVLICILPLVSFVLIANIYEIIAFNIPLFIPMFNVLYFCGVSISAYLIWKGRFNTAVSFFTSLYFTGMLALLFPFVFPHLDLLDMGHTMSIDQIIATFVHLRDFFYPLLIVIALFTTRKRLTFATVAIVLLGLLLFYNIRTEYSGLHKSQLAILNGIVFGGSVGFLLSFVFLFSFSRITEKSLEVAEDELAKNKELNANLEQKVKERTQKLKDVEKKISKYLPKQLVESITSGQQEVVPATERRKLSIFFSDIKGFTTLTESLEAEELSAILNEYLTEMTNIAHKWGGTIDKVIGDAIMIFFGAPETTPDKDNALNCVKMAIEMQQKMKELQEKWFNEGIETPLEIRIGVSTGTATVGNFGAADRLSYTVIGGQVNIASRLESICDPNSILISHPTWAFVKDEIPCTPRDKVTVKGIHREIMTYDVVMG